MINENLRKKIADMGFPDSYLYDNPSFDNSIIGITDSGRVVYDYDMMAQEFVEDDKEYSIKQYMDALPDNERDSVTEEQIMDDLLMEAYEFIDYNTIRATPYMGSRAPMVRRDLTYTDGEFGYDYSNVVSGEPFTEKINQIV